LNQTYDDILFKLQDDRIQILLSAIYIKGGIINLAEPILMQLLEKAEENTGMMEDFLIQTIYINSSFLFGKLTNIEVAMKYINKILLTFSPETTKDNEYMRIAFENYSLLCDYVYTDPVVRFEHCKKLNYFYPSSKLFPNFLSLQCRDTSLRKIKIGYVSNAFKDHAVSNFILPILDNHDTERFDVFLFTHHVYKHDKFPTFNINKKSADVCAKLIYDLGIHILIDIDGHTSGNRLDIFSKNPAPIQMTYLGFPNSTALDFIQYRITDRVADHPDSKQIYSENRLNMPRCFLLYKTDESLIISSDQNIFPEKNHIILGSLNKEPKNSKNVLQIWKQILQLTTNTKLLIKISSVDNVENRIKFYKDALEIEEDRLIIVEFCSNEEYMNLFYKIDILLDTFPYSGTTTTCHALHASTPVVTLYHKDYHAHNVSSSLLINSGFPELISYSENEYVEKVIDLCNQPEKLAEYKTTIRQGFLELMEPKQFMKEYEDILSTLYHNYGEP
jgi:predicted O-linked N-acetylglucosamine transferase (SPINDLY family)